MVTTVKNNEIPDFAGDYVLKEVIIINHIGKKIDVKNIMTELNIYESIFKNAVTGSVILADTTNQIARMSIQGLEKISFKLATPGVAYGKEDVVDATEETGEPYYIYKVTDRKQATPNMMIYTLHFASREFMRNMRTKVSQAYDGKYDRAVIDIMKDENYSIPQEIQIMEKEEEEKYVYPKIIIETEDVGIYDSHSITFEKTIDEPPIYFSMGMLVHDDKLYVANTDDHEIQIFDKNNLELITDFTSPLQYPCATTNGFVAPTNCPYLSRNLPTSLSLLDEKIFVNYGNLYVIQNKY